MSLDKQYPCICMTDEHVEIMKHTRDRAAKNLYCGDSKEMQDLVTLGLMESAGRKPFVPSEYFRLTEKGNKMLENEELLNGL